MCPRTVPAFHCQNLKRCRLPSSGVPSLTGMRYNHGNSGVRSSTPTPRSGGWLPQWSRTRSAIVGGSGSWGRQSGMTTDRQVSRSLGGKAPGGASGCTSTTTPQIHTQRPCRSGMAGSERLSFGRSDPEHTGSMAQLGLSASRRLGGHSRTKPLAEIRFEIPHGSSSVLFL